MNSNIISEGTQNILKQYVYEYICVLNTCPNVCIFLYTLHIDKSHENIHVEGNKVGPDVYTDVFSANCVKKNISIHIKTGYHIDFT